MRWGGLLVFFLLVACAPPRPLPPEAAARVLADSWATDDQVWRLRQTALFEMRGAKVPLSGLLRLDNGRRQARLIGLNDLGVKLFDISVTPEGEEVHYLFPELTRFPGAGEAIAASLRRIYLTPQPLPSDQVTAAGEGWRLQRQTAAGSIEFHFDRERHLRQKRTRGEGEDWRVRYADYRLAAGRELPGLAALDDFQGGYRLTLWLDEVKKEDE